MTDDLSEDINTIDMEMEMTVDASEDEMIASNCESLTEPTQPNWIGWGNVQYPPSQTLRPGQMSEPIYGQLWIQGQTETPGAANGAQAQLVIGPWGAQPSEGSCFQIIDATYHLDVGNNDEYQATITAPHTTGVYGYFYRYRTMDGSWRYAAQHTEGAGFDAEDAGQLIIKPLQAPSKLKVLTLNLQCTQNNWPERRQRMLDWIQQLRPDIIGLQEDCIDGQIAQSKQLQQAIAARYNRGMMRIRASTHQATVMGQAVDEGVSILSAYPTVAHDILTLQHHHFPRKAIGITINFGDRQVRIYNTHYDYSAQAADARFMSSVAILSDIQKMGLPAIVMGDLNATPTQEEVKRLGAVLTDTWASLYPEDAGPTFPSNGPNRRIDYILSSATFEVQGTQRINGDFSDHLGVYTELILGR